MKKIILSFLTIVLITISLKAQIPTAGLVGHYDFSNGALTDSINSVNFSKTGTAATTITDRFGNANEAISLNGDDLLRPDIDFNTSTSNPYLARTISFWIKTATNDGNVRLIYNDNNRTNVGAVNYNGLIVFLQNGQIKASNRVGSNGNLVTHTTSVSDNAWHHITIQGYSTAISGVKRFYTYIFVDGAKEGGNGYQTSSGSVSVTENEYIGSLGFSRLSNISLSNTQKYQDGLDEVLFYTRSLSDLEVDSIRTNGFCTVNIPDANFKAYLVGNTLINTNGDSEIQCSEASAYTGTINCNALSISDLTGIEAFTSLTYLSFTNNTISSIDLSQNTALIHFYCENNLLTNLDLSLNTSLKTLYCQDNQLTSLSLTNNTQLSNLRCSENSLTSLNVTTNPDLKYLFCNDNQISSLDVSQHILLEELIVSDNNLTSLDITANTALEELQIDQNQISIIDLSQNVLLEKIFCRNTALTNLDCSNNSSLYWIVANNNNNLQSMDVSNGNNTNVSFFWAHNNPNLTCITVDDVTYSTANWTGSSFKFDAASSFSTNCNACTINIPDANFKAYLVGNTAINTNGNTEIECSEASAFTGNINCTSQSIADLTGIEEFVNLEYLFCSSNQITNLDLSNNTSLVGLRCPSNQLSSLDLSSNIALTEVLCNMNQITSLTLPTSGSFVTFWCNDNQLTSIDISNVTVTDFRCFNNQITNLDLSNNNALTTLRCEQNNLMTLNVANGNNTNLSIFNASNNPNLTCIQVDDEVYSTTNWTFIDAQTSFSENCMPSPVLVNSISVQGQAGVSSISTSGGTLQMEATVLPANADDATYTWSVTNGTGAATISSTGLLTATADGTVEVTATANDASGETGTKMITISNQTVDPGTGINDISFENLNVYPNPTNNILNLEINEKLTAIKILDLAGKTVKTFKAETKQLDVSELRAGIYFLELANADKKSVVKIIKK